MREHLDPASATILKDNIWLAETGWGGPFRQDLSNGVMAPERDVGGSA